MNRREYDPTSGMLTLREAMNRLLEDSFVTGLPAGATATARQMPLDVYETGDAIVVRASMPGVRPEDIDVTVTGDTLTIRGELRDTTPGPAEVRHHQREHRFGVMARSLTLPIEVQSDKVEATFEHGVLTLTMPKAARLQPRTIRITTRGGATSVTTDSAADAASGSGGADAGATEPATGRAARGEKGTERGSVGETPTRTKGSSATAAGPSDADTVPSSS